MEINRMTECNGIVYIVSGVIRQNNKNILKYVKTMNWKKLENFLYPRKTKKVKSKMKKLFFR